MSLKEIIESNFTPSQSRQSEEANKNVFVSQLNLGDQHGDQGSLSGEQSTVFTRIDVKPINYLTSNATAVYFEDMTQQVEQIRLESKILEEQNRRESMESYTSTISHEFRTPIATALMFLEMLMKDGSISENAKRTLKIVVSTLNMSLCLVNDLLDIKMIEQNKFQAKEEKFVPQQLFEFIVNMFAVEAAFSKTKISFKSVNAA